MLRSVISMGTIKYLIVRSGPLGDLADGGKAQQLSHIQRYSCARAGNAYLRLTRDKARN